MRDLGCVGLYFVRRNLYALAVLANIPSLDDKSAYMILASVAYSGCRWISFKQRDKLKQHTLRILGTDSGDAEDRCNYPPLLY